MGTNGNKNVDENADENVNATNNMQIEIVNDQAEETVEQKTASKLILLLSDRI